MDRSFVTDRPSTPKRNFRVNPLATNQALRLEGSGSWNNEFTKMQTAGIKRCRMECTLADMAPSEWNYSLISKYDNIINLAATYDIEIIMLLVQYGMPEWANGTTNTFVAPPPATYARWCYDMALRYKGRVSLFEMGNEPNFYFFWPSGPDPEEFMDLQKAAYPAIKRANPEAIAIMGGLGGWYENNDNGFRSDEFLTGMYQNGLKNYCDYVAIHPYVQPLSNGSFANTLINIDDLRQIMIDFGDEDKHMMITEGGWTTATGTGVSEAVQAANIKTFYETVMFNEDYNFIDIVALYNFRNAGSNPASDEHNYGIIRNNGIDLKPSYQSYIDVSDEFSDNFIEKQL